MAKYSIQKQIDSSFDDVVIKVREALKNEGFGVLTEIDVRDTLKQKLGVNFQNYLILGACHPPSAYEALQADQEIGLLLPCNVIVYESSGTVHVSVIRPTVAMQIDETVKLAEIAEGVEAKLGRVIKSI